MGGKPVGDVVRRIVVTGPECTGKSTLARQLAESLQVPLLPESARTYAEEVGRALCVDDIEKIARRAIAAEELALALRPPAIVLDTDLLSTVLYGRHYYGVHNAWLEREARARRGDCYLLCLPDIPWVPDGIRDRPDRPAMLALFREVIEEFGAKAWEVRGLGGARQKHAMEIAMSDVMDSAGAAL